MSSSLQIDPRLASTVCCCLFRGLATIAVLELAQNGTHFGNGARSKIFSLRTYHEWPVGKRAISVCGRGEKYGWIWRSRLHRFLFATERRRETGTADRTAIRPKRH